MSLIDYAFWHYTVAPVGILGLLRNYLTGNWHRFLIGRHFKTLFAPWHRAKPSDIGGVETFGDKILNAVVDFYIRIIAAVIRLLIIVMGLIWEAVTTVAFILLLVIWLLWPIILVFAVGRGLSLIFNL